MLLLRWWRCIYFRTALCIWKGLLRQPVAPLRWLRRMQLARLCRNNVRDAAFLSLAGQTVWQVCEFQECCIVCRRPFRRVLVNTY